MKPTKLIFILLLVFVLSPVQAKHVDKQTAMTVGKKFLSTVEGFDKLKGSLNLSLVYEERAEDSTNLKTSLPETYYYIFNVNGKNGFLIISGDDQMTPILGYSDEGGLDPDNISPALASWLSGYKQQIRFIQTHSIPASIEIKNQWDAEFCFEPVVQGVNSIQPLTKTKWDQGPPYNASCPMVGNDRAVTGCVATAMAQIMKYWNYPATGQNNHSYFDYGSGKQLAADFGSTTYNWSEMPNEPQTNVFQPALATLMSHCGIGVDMQYGNNKDGSSASITGFAGPSSEYALKTYFGYSTQLTSIQMADYSPTEWENILKKELIDGRPILYRGKRLTPTIGGHAFVCDGFNSQSYFHFNWGWGGGGNGNFLLLSNLESGNGDFSQEQMAVIGIQPPADRINYDIRLYRSMVVSPNPVNYGSLFTVTTNFRNYGNTQFVGEFCAAAFDTDGNFIDYIQIWNGETLPSGHVYTNDVQFTNSQLYKLLPGNYNIRVYYRPTGGSWKAINSGIYTNYLSLKVQWSSNIELYKSITVTPQPLIQGSPATFSFDISNNGSTAFNGMASIAFYDLDGTNGQTIQTSGSLLLPVNSHYTNGLTFQTAALNVNPGTYLCAILHTDASGNAKLTGATNFQNPIKVTVLPAPLYADIYEPNNSVAASYLLPIVFNGNQAQRNTQGSNLHLTTDIDYYKVFLPPGYNYTINGSLLNESYNPTSDNYTLKGQVYFSTNLTTWTDRSTGSFSYPQSIPGGTMLYMVVSGEESGYTGMYRLDLIINRTQGASMDATLSDLKVDGVTIAGFDTETRVYQYVLPYGTTSIPTVTATTTHPKATKTISSANMLPGVTTVKVTAENGTTTRSYDVYFSVSTLFVDLLISNVSFYPPSIVPGGSMIASATIRNQGNVLATGVKTNFYLSQDEILDETDLLLRQSEGYNLTGVSSQQITALITLWNQTAPGSYFIISYVDKDMTIKESNESNNLYISPLTVTSNTGVEQTFLSDLINVYPNPARDYIKIDLTDFQGVIDRIELVNNLGQVVYSDSGTHNIRVIQLSTAGLASGFYAVLVTSGDRRVKKTMIIE